MSAQQIDVIGGIVAVVIVFAIGYWLHNVNKKPDDERIEALAIGFGLLGMAIVLAGRVTGTI